MLGYAIGSVEGRIGVEYFDPSPEIQDKKYAFKCHRQNIEDVDHVWPVNALAFHPVYASSRSFAVINQLTLITHTMRSDIIHSHLQGQTAPSPSGTIRSKNALDSTRNMPLRSPASRSTATAHV